MEVCHFRFFLVRKEHRKDVKCKAFTTTKWKLKGKNPGNYNVKNTISRKIIKYTDVLGIFLDPWVLKLHTEMWEGGKNHTQWQRAVLSAVGNVDNFLEPV